MFRRSVNLEILILINGEHCNIVDGSKILRYFSSKTKKIVAINIYDRVAQPSASLSINSALEILLENGKKNNWKLKVLVISLRSMIPTKLGQFLNFAKNTLEELKLYPLCYSCTNFPTEEVSQCLKLQELDSGKVKFNLNTFKPILQPSQLSLVKLRVDLSENATTTLVAILKRFRNTLQEIRCYSIEDISLNEVLSEFEENDEPVRDLWCFNYTWLSDLSGNIDVKKLFRIFPSLESLIMFQNFVENSLYQFARDFLDLFHHASPVRELSIISEDHPYAYGVKVITNHLVEAFPSPLYKWEIVTHNSSYVFVDTYEVVHKIVIQRGNAQITLFLGYY